MLEQRKLSLVGACNKANIFLGLIEYELNIIIGASHLVDYISVYIRLYHIYISYIYISLYDFGCIV